MTAVATQTVRLVNPPTLLQRVAQHDKLAVRTCVESYGNFIWALAKKFTTSREEAEAATQEIFIDIWRYAQRLDIIHEPDDQIISLIARRRLFKYLH